MNGSQEGQLIQDITELKVDIKYIKKMLEETTCRFNNHVETSTDYRNMVENNKKSIAGAFHELSLHRWTFVLLISLISGMFIFITK